MPARGFRKPNKAVRTNLLSIILLLLGALAAPLARAQSDALLTQYFAVPTFYNPAAVGQQDSIRLRAGMRLQWMGIDHAPRTFLATGDMPFKFLNRRWGTGLKVQSESYGLFRNLTIDAQLGWKKKNLWKGELTAALELGLVSETFKGTDVFIPDGDDYHQSEDEAIPKTDVNGMALDVGLGVWYTHPWFWLGVSGSHLTEPTIRFTSDSEGGMSSGGTGAEGETAKNYEFKVLRTVYVMGGSNIPIKNTLFELLPSFLFYMDSSFTGFEVTARGRWNRFLTAGVGYRHNDALSLTLAAEFKGFWLGYSYDYPLSDISKASSGSHEIMAGYSLKLDMGEKNKNRHKSIRIM